MNLIQTRGRAGHLPPPGGYVPVYTLHEMYLETNQRPQIPVVICTGCGHDIPSPAGSARIQCRDCGRKMQIVSVSPAGDRGKAGN